MSDLNKRAIDAIFNISSCFGKDKHPNLILQEILEALETTLDYRKGMVTMIDPDSGDILIEAAQGIDKKLWSDIRYRKGEGITGIIMDSGESLAIPLVGKDPRFVHRLGIYNPESAFVGVPIVIEEKIIGSLGFTIDPAERYQLSKHEMIARLFANLIGGVMSRLLKAEKEKEDIIREKDKLHYELKGKMRVDNMVGTSKVMRAVFENIQQVAKWNTPVLVRGESGTGKELVAKGIHYQSLRSEGPFVKMNCAALPDNLIESELFGYEKGAFTGAVARKPGRFELAHKGTLFLDEVGDTSPAFQAKLLRVLQEGQFERLGGTQTITVDVRIIAATNVNLEQAVSENKFREDLYYRLNVMPIFLMPLRERKEDIPYLVDHFLKQLEKESGRKFSIDAEALNTLEQCDWKGNVRELENCVQRSAVTSKGDVIKNNNIPCSTNQCFNRLLHNGGCGAATPTAVTKPSVASDNNETKLEEIANERDRVIAALDRSGWVQAKAARLLNMTPRQIAYRIIKLNIEVKSL
ncbi:MAG: nif-specific transcriptional activator NifA [Nitrospinae bacterium]|nr:nif-specific transcriptional activator NifA [Nitrospinota bacterium]